MPPSDINQTKKCPPLNLHTAAGGRIYTYMLLCAIFLLMREYRHIAACWEQKYCWCQSWTVAWYRVAIIMVVMSEVWSQMVEEASLHHVTWWSTWWSSAHVSGHWFHKSLKLKKDIKMLSKRSNCVRRILASASSTCLVAREMEEGETCLHEKEKCLKAWFFFVWNVKVRGT